MTITVARTSPLTALALIFSMWLCLTTAHIGNAQELCLRPMPPPEILPTDDAEMRELIQEDFQRYFDEIGWYLECLRREQLSAEQESKVVIEAWQKLFGK